MRSPRRLVAPCKATSSWDRTAGFPTAWCSRSWGSACATLSGGWRPPPCVPTTRRPPAAPPPTRQRPHPLHGRHRPTAGRGRCTGSRFPRGRCRPGATPAHCCPAPQGASHSRRRAQAPAPVDDRGGDRRRGAPREAKRVRGGLANGCRERMTGGVTRLSQIGSRLDTLSAARRYAT